MWMVEERTGLTPKRRGFRQVSWKIVDLLHNGEIFAGYGRMPPNEDPIEYARKKAEFEHVAATMNALDYPVRREG